MKIFSDINCENILKKTSFTPCFKAKGISPDIKKSFINLSPEKRSFALQELSKKLEIPVSLLISFLGLEKFYKIEKKEENLVNCYKKGNVTVSKKWYESGNGVNTPIKKEELYNIFDYIESNILNNPKFKDFDIFFIIHMPYEKIILRFKEKYNNLSDNNYKFIQGTYKNNVIDIDLSKI